MKAVIFDLDGTIADTIEDLASACNEVLRAAGMQEKPVEYYIPLIGGGRTKLLQDVAPKYAEEHLDEMMECFNKYYSVHYMDKTKRYDGMLEVIEKVRTKGYKTAVLSNKPQEMTRPIILELYPGLFDCVYGGEKNIPVKPDPKAAERVLNDLDVEAEETVVVGDSGVDIKTAQNIGAKCIAVTWGYRSRDDLKALSPDFIADCPDEILRAIENIEEK